MTDPQLVDLLKELIAIPSVNPEDNADTLEAGEGRLAAFLAARLVEQGFQAKLHDEISGRPNIVAAWGPETPRKTILLEAHLDTVGVGVLKRPPFQGVVENGRLYGRGACDDKGPMAAALYALSAEVLTALAKGGVRLIFVGAMGEEKGNVGALQLAASGLCADEAIVLEPTELRLVHAHKGPLWVRIEVRGLAAHGSHPERGRSAIEDMQHVLAMLRSLPLTRKNPLLGSPTLNIGKIEGGSAVNIVPDFCRIDVDRRTLPGEDNETALAAIEQGLQQLQACGKIKEYTLQVVKKGQPFETATNSSLVCRMKAAIEKSGRKAETAGAGWYSDAGPLSSCCKEVVVFGPGRIEEAHTAEEYIDLDSLQAGYSIIRDFLLASAQSKE